MITDTVRDILVKGYLDGVPQIQGAAKTDKGVCAIGLLYEHLVEQGFCSWIRTKAERRTTYHLLDPKDQWIRDTSLLEVHYGLLPGEINAIAMMNDSSEKPTFLDIARKVGINDVDDS